MSYSPFDDSPKYHDSIAGKSNPRAKQKEEEHDFDRPEDEMSLGEFASSCGDDEFVWGYDGDIW